MKVYIYGAGEIGKQVVMRLKTLNVEKNIIGIIDKKKTGSLLTIPILKIEECKKDAPVIVAVKKGRMMNEIVRDLRARGFSRLYWYRGEVCGNAFPSFLEKECYDLSDYSYLLIEHLEVHLADGCNLNCRGCTHYAPLFSPGDFPDLTEVLDDIQAVSEKVDVIESIMLMGGEPFLNPQFGEYVIKVRQLLQYSTITVVTNGLLVEKVSDENLRKVAEANALLSITGYPPTRAKLDRIKDILTAHNIKWEVRGHVDEDKFNLPLTTNDNTSLEHFCMSGNCMNIWHGKIARCPSLMYISKINEVFNKNFPETGIKRIKDIDGEEIMRLAGSDVELCKYCVKNIINWSKCKPVKEESDFLTNI